MAEWSTPPRWQGMSLTRKVVVATGVLVLIGLLAMAPRWFDPSGEAVLFSNLSPDDTHAVLEKLHEAKIHYTLDGSGTVRVAAVDVPETRRKLAEDGLPGTKGFEVLDKDSLGTFGDSPSKQRQHYQLALQGELARAIARIPGVRHARVYLVLPDAAPFSAKKDPVSAGVVVTMQPGHERLARKQVDGIVHLLASSVEGLRPEMVTVTDGAGHLLHAAQPPGADGRAATLEATRTSEWAEDLESKIRTMLEAVVGPGNAQVVLTASLDYVADVHEEQVRFDPEGQVVRSEQKSKDESTDLTRAPGGVAGVASNTPSLDAPLPAAAERAGGSASEQRSTVNYEISQNKTVTKASKPMGKRLTAAVIVDGRYEPVAATATEGGTAEAQTVAPAKTFVPRSPEELKQIESLVKDAMGYQEDRGDRVTVSSLPMENGPITDTHGTTASADESVTATVVHASRPAGMTVVMLVLALAVYLVMKQILRSPLGPAAAAGDLMVPMTVTEAEKQLKGGDGAGPRGGIPASRHDPKPSLVADDWLSAARRPGR